jgi:hypothetical protein
VKKNKKSLNAEYVVNIGFLKDGKIFNASKGNFTFYIFNKKVYLTNVKYKHYNIESLIAGKEVVAKTKAFGNLVAYNEPNTPSSELENSYYLFSVDDSSPEKFGNFIFEDFCDYTDSSINFIGGYTNDKKSFKNQIVKVANKNIWEGNGFVFNHFMHDGKIDTIEYKKVPRVNVTEKYTKYEFIPFLKQPASNSPDRSADSEKEKVASQAKQTTVVAKTKSEEEGEAEEASEEQEEESKENKIDEKNTVEVIFDEETNNSVTALQNREYKKYKLIEGNYVNGKLDGDLYNYNNSLKNFKLIYSGVPNYIFKDSTYLQSHLKYKAGVLLKREEYKLMYVYDDKVKDDNGYTLSKIIPYISKMENFNNEGKLHGIYFEQAEENRKLDEVSVNIYLKSKGNYLNGKKDGLWETYHEAVPHNVKNRSNYKNGSLMGVSETYNEQGELISKTVHN